MTRRERHVLHKGVTRSAVEEPQAVRSRVDPTIFKSYDVRGVYPSELSDDVAYAIGRCFVPLLGSAALGQSTVVVGRDMRPSGRKLCDAFARGATDAGADVVDIGMVSTDALYFAVGKFELRRRRHDHGIA